MEMLGCSFRHQHPDWCLSSLALNSGKKTEGHSLNISYISYTLSTRLFKTCFQHLLSWCSSLGLCIVLKREENNNHESARLSPNLICLQYLLCRLSFSCHHQLKAAALKMTTWNRVIMDFQGMLMRERWLSQAGLK